MNEDIRKRIVIVGAGFAGVKCARVLKRAKLGVEIVVFNRDNHMVFQPLLADVAGSALNPRAVAAPLRQMLKGVRCRTEEITDIDLEKRCVKFLGFHGDARELEYDELVLALGNRVDLSRVPGMANYALPLKTIGDAIAMRARVMERLEQADTADDPELRRWLASFIVIGGGFSGVEVAGEINDLLRHSHKYFSCIQASELRVTLVHSRQQILPELRSPKLRDFALERMRRAGVQFRLEARASAVTRRGIQLSNGETLEGATVICTVGNTPHELIQRIGLPQDRGRLKCNPDMRVEGQDCVWALGDCALIPNAHDGELSPPTAQFAERQGKQAAGNIIRKLNGDATRPFCFKPVGAAAGIGSRSGVAELYGFRISGFAAWWLWRSAFLIKLPSMLQKIKVGLDWAWEVLFPRDISHFKPAMTQPVSHFFFAEGETIADQASCERRLFVIENGQCEIVESRDGSADRVLVVLGRGEIIGQRTLAGFGSGSSVRLRARTNTEVVALADDFLEQISALLKPIQKLVQDATTAHEDYWQHVPGAPARLESVLVKELMRELPASELSPGQTILDGLRTFHATGQSYALVRDETDGLLVGIVTRTDLIAGIRKGTAALIERIMTREPVRVCESDNAALAANTLQERGVKWLPVVASLQSQRPVGIIYADDLLSFALELGAPAGAA